MAGFDMGKARILIVEDEAVVAENPEMAISDAGYDVVVLAAIGGFGAWMRYLLQEPSC